MRLFVAILLDDEVRAALARVQQQLARECSGVRWVRQDQLHITAKFLGEVPDRDVAGVSKALEQAAMRLTPFEMTLKGCGCFPPRGAVRIVWAGIEEPSGSLLRTVEAVEEALAELGFPRERRPFSPHITIGRVKQDTSGGSWRPVVSEFEFPVLAQPVEKITLMSSVLAPHGPRYSIVSAATLGSKQANG